MSDTTAGLLQVGAADRCAGRVLPPAGRLHGARLHQRARPARRAGHLPGRSGSTRRPTSAGRSTPRSVLAFSLVSVLVPVRAAAVPGRTCRCRSGFPGVDAGAGVQHRGLVRDQHELAVLLRRVDDGPPDADGRARGAELRLRRGRHRRRDRADPRLHPLAAPTGSATSGSTWSAACLRILLPLAVVAAIALIALGAVQNLSSGTDADHPGRRSPDHHRRPGRLPGGHQGARHQRRRLLQRQLLAPVREPQRADATCFEIFLLLLIPFA